jgi:hypothetical protein
MRDERNPGFLVLALLTGAVFVWSQQKTMPMVAPTQLVLSANPVTIPATQSTSVTFSVRAIGAVPNLLELFQLGADGVLRPVGKFEPSGGGSYSLELPIGQRGPGTLVFVAKSIVAVVEGPPNPGATSNTVQISVTQMSAPPPQVRVLFGKLTPNMIVQGQAANLRVEARISSRTALQVTVRRADTNETLATLNQSRIFQLTKIASFAVYSGSFDLVASNAGVMALQIVATGQNLPAPATYAVSLTVSPAAQAGPSTNPASSTVSPAAQTGPSTNPASSTFSRIGISLAVPAGWRVNQDIYDSGGPIALDNFGSNYGQSVNGQLCCGGVIAMNGATIDVTGESTNGISADSYPQTELRGAENIAVDQTQVGGIAATRAHYDDTYTAGLRFSNIAVYAGQGSLVYKFYLSYRAGDPHTPDFTNAFQTLLDSVQFTRGQR